MRPQLLLINSQTFSFHLDLSTAASDVDGGPDDLEEDEEEDEQETYR